MAPTLDWQSDESHILLDTALQKKPAPQLRQLPELRAHIWLTTSGTSANRDEIKVVALSKRAFLASAAAVNAHLRVGSEDIWFLALPDFHVGGLSISARAHLSSSAVRRWPGVEQKWNAQRFYTDLCESRSTLISLVPTQIWDLVNLQLQAPDFLRAAVVGGGALALSLYRLGRTLGWPLLPSYGLTECCSQVATAELASLWTTAPSRLRILSHVSGKTNADKILSINSPSLLTGIATITGTEVRFHDPKVAGWFRTQDMVEVTGNYLTFLGRRDDYVKIKGKNVSRLALQNILERVLSEAGRREQACVVMLDDARRGKQVVMAITTQDEAILTAITEAFNQEVLAHERIRTSRPVPYIPRTALGKVRLDDLARMLT